MPKFQVAGADAQTGSERSLIIEADHQGQAAEIAKVRGLFVSKVVELPPAPVLNYVANGQSHGEPEPSRPSRALPLRQSLRNLVADFASFIAFVAMIAAVAGIFGGSQLAATLGILWFIAAIVLRHHLISYASSSRPGKS